jgi:hypothetical protein
VAVVCGSRGGRAVGMVTCDGGGAGAGLWDSIFEAATQMRAPTGAPTEPTCFGAGCRLLIRTHSYRAENDRRPWLMAMGFTLVGNRAPSYCRNGLNGSVCRFVPKVVYSCPEQLSVFKAFCIYY